MANTIPPTLALPLDWRGNREDPRKPLTDIKAPKTSALDYLVQGGFEPAGSRVLLRAVSTVEAQGLSIYAPGTEHEDKNVAYYIVEAIGPKVKNTKVGDRVLHTSAAADKVIAKYGCIKERYIIAYLRD